jgi:hypothetical protein
MKISFRCPETLAKKGIIEFLMDIPYEGDNLEFDPNLHRTRENIEILTRRFSIIAETKRVDLIGHVEIQDVEFTLQGSIYFYRNPYLVWKLPEVIIPHVDTYLTALEPELIGTAQHYLRELKYLAKKNVCETAIHRAHIMKKNANAIMAFLRFSSSFHSIIGECDINSGPLKTNHSSGTPGSMPPWC